MRIAVTISGSARTASTSRLMTSSDDAAEVAGDQADRRPEHGSDERRRRGDHEDVRAARRARGRACPVRSYRCRTGNRQLGGRLVRELVVEDRVVRVTSPGRGRRRPRRRPRWLPITTVGERRSSRTRSERAARDLAEQALSSAPRIADLVTRHAPEPDPGVEDGVEDVGDQRHHQVDDPDHEDARRQQREVLLSAASSTSRPIPW